MDEQIYALAQELVEVGRLRDSDDVTGVVERLVTRAAQTIPGCDHVTVTVRIAADKLETVAGGEVASLAHTGSEEKPWPGPILDAVLYREPRRVDDVETEQRWEGFQQRMQEAGFRSCLALPMPTQRHPRVGFTLFSTRSHQFSDLALDLVSLFALQAGTVIDNASLYNDARQLIEHLHESLATREVIGQAKGILMRRLPCDDETAFDVLRRISQHHNIKVRKVAADIVDSQQRGRLDSALMRWFMNSGSNHRFGDPGSEAAGDAAG